MLKRLNITSQKIKLGYVQNNIKSEKPCARRPAMKMGVNTSFCRHSGRVTSLGITECSKGLK